ncbi:TetR/AcrR family transcriptional regulator [Agrobacterium rosae]|uniref:TetR/AcrR family transcriptional regulator n=1 Tax=Agrobacterium rosae TaxID=1972867 RepID=UPI003A80846D
MTNRSEAARLTIARAAARLFIEQGVAATQGSDIAREAGISERTIWRHFRNKESCVGPLFSRSWANFAAQMRSWPRAVSLEAHLATCFDLERRSPEELADAILIVRLIAIVPDEPDVRSIWLLSYHNGEGALAEIIADRLDRSRNDFEVILCAVATMGAVRTIDETISLAAVHHRQIFTTAEVVTQMAKAIRSVSNMAFCDPVKSKPFGIRPVAPVDGRTR